MEPRPSTEFWSPYSCSQHRSRCSAPAALGAAACAPNRLLRFGHVFPNRACANPLSGSSPRGTSPITMATPPREEPAAPHDAGAAPGTPSDAELLERTAQAATKLRAAIASVVVGQDEVVDSMLVTLAARGHALLVGV